MNSGNESDELADIKLHQKDKTHTTNYIGNSQQSPTGSTSSQKDKDEKITG